MDCFVNVLCVYLRFDFADDVYNKLCTCCHNCCEKGIGCCIDCKKQERLPSVSYQDNGAGSVATDKDGKQENTLNPYSNISSTKPNNTHLYGLSLDRNHNSNSTRLESELTKTNETMSTQPMHAQKSSKSQMNEIGLQCVHT